MGATNPLLLISSLGILAHGLTVGWLAWAAASEGESRMSRAAWYVLVFVWWGLAILLGFKFHQALAYSGLFLP